MPHDHEHQRSLPQDDGKVVAAVSVNLGLTIVQIVAGVVSGSLAMIADAIHNLSDAISLIIALAARKLARRPADASMTFGYGRIEVVAALVNYTTLIVIALWLLPKGSNACSTRSRCRAGSWWSSQRSRWWSIW